MSFQIRPRQPARQRRATVAAVCAAVCAAVALLPASGCEDNPAIPPPIGRVTLLLDHRVGTDALRFDSRDYTNAAGNAYSVFELHYFVSNLELVRSDNTVHAAGGVHLRDANVAATREWRLTDIPDGHYTKLRFRFGLDSQHNVPQGLPPTVEYDRMQWPETVGGGYHFMMLDGFFLDSAATNMSWIAHLGRLSSQEHPGPLDTSFEVELPVVLHVAGDEHFVRVIMDVNAWFASPHVYDFDVFTGSNMNNPVALSALHDNGAHVFQLGTVASETGSRHR